MMKRSKRIGIPNRQPLEVLDMTVEVGSVSCIDADFGSLEEVEGMNDLG